MSIVLGAPFKIFPNFFAVKLFTFVCLSCFWEVGLWANGKFSLNVHTSQLEKGGV
jgi:hypothetical protein